MVIKYYDFLIEKMILESEVVFSDEFRNILLNMTHPLSNNLVKIENKDLDVKYNFLDISTDDNNKISFVSDNKTKSVLKSIDGNLKNVDIDEEDKKSVWSKNRQEIKVGRAIRSILKSADVDFNDDDLRNFIFEYRIKISEKENKSTFFEVVSGDDIAYWYNKKNFLKNEGDLGASCMSDKDSKFFDIYVKNPHSCSLLILKSPTDNTKIVGRALLWTLICGKKFLDRIYTIDESDIELFRDYAKKNKWYVKKEINSQASNIAISPNGEEVILNLTVDVFSHEYKFYPYLDTLKYYDVNKQTLSTRDTPNALNLESTDGSFSGCPFCLGTGIYDCNNCDSYGTVTCNTCDGNGGVKCNFCDGEVYIECKECDGYGKIEDDDGEEVTCYECGGDGDIKCNFCDGHGEETCVECDGSGQSICSECEGDGKIYCYYC